MSEFKSSGERSTDSQLFSLSQIMHLMRVEFSRAQRYKYPLACLMVAVDRLSQLRDMYGYDSKEAILDEVVRLLQAQTRSCDFLGRLADDKLLAVLPHTPPDGAKILAERLLSGVRTLDFQSEGRKLQISVSVGASQNVGDSTLFFDALLVASETALAHSVSSGGDRYTYRDPGETGT